MQTCEQTSRYPTRYFFCAKKLLIWACFSLGLAFASHCFAAEMYFSNSDTEFRDLFCTRSKTETNTLVRLYRLKDGKPECLFEKNLQGGIEPPICFSNSVVIVNAYGVVRKFSISGDLLYEGVPAGISGACSQSGRINPGEIYVAETLWNKKKQRWDYRLDIVNIAGTAPLVKKTFESIQTIGVVRALDELVVVGEHDVRRLKLQSD